MVELCIKQPPFNTIALSLITGVYDLIHHAANPQSHWKEPKMVGKMHTLNLQWKIQKEHPKYDAVQALCETDQHSCRMQGWRLQNASLQLCQWEKKPPWLPLWHGQMGRRKDPQRLWQTCPFCCWMAVLVETSALSRQPQSDQGSVL